MADDAHFITVCDCVALRKESVDRNIIYLLTASAFLMSLSARRAWIEITVVGVLATLVTASLSARRAWIEMKQKSDRSLQK